MFSLKTKYGVYKNCSFVKEGSGTQTRYSVFTQGDENSENEEERFPGCVFKLNLPGYTEGLGKDLEKDSVVAIFNHSENEGMLDFLDKLGVVKNVYGYLEGPYVKIPVAEINTEKLMKLNDCKEIDFTTGKAVRKDGRPFEPPVLSIGEWDKAVTKLDKQDGYHVAKNAETYSFTVKNVAQTKIELRPVVGRADVFYATESCNFFGKVQDFYAKVDRALLVSKGVLPEKAKHSLAPKQDRNNSKEISGRE